ncbi:hypothetical protein AB3456_08525 [Staphylococcus pseudoxylosus]|nr:hypothetical protein [Staphylococcus xylosus]
MKKALAYATKFYRYTNKHMLNDVEVLKKAKTLEDIEKEEKNI